MFDVGHVTWSCLVWGEGRNGAKSRSGHPGTAAHGQFQPPPSFRL